MDIKALAQQMTIQQAAILVAHVLAAQDHTAIKALENVSDEDSQSYRNSLIEAYQTNPLSTMNDNYENQEVVNLIEEAIVQVAPEYKLP